MFRRTVSPAETFSLLVKSMVLAALSPLSTQDGTWVDIGPRVAETVLMDTGELIAGLPQDLVAEAPLSRASHARISSLSLDMLEKKEEQVNQNVSY